MSKPNRISRRIAAAVAAGCAGLMLAGTAGAVDLRDWGRKYNTASERFAVLASFSNAAVLDKETQLVWTRAPNGTASWIAALSNCHLAGVGSRFGWRLPSTSELSSLLVGEGGGQLPAGHPFWSIGNNQFYWSGTEQASNTNYAYAVKLAGQSAPIANHSKLTTLAYFCVRGVGPSHNN